MRQKLRATVLLVLVAVAAIVLSPSPAWAIKPLEVNSATIDSSHEDFGCDAWAPPITDSSGNEIFEACFVKFGDVLAVFDLNTQAGNGFGWMQWQNDLKDANGNWKPYRHGECWLRTAPDVAGYCDKDFYENSTNPNALGGQGSRIGFKACSSDNRYGCGSLVWVTNNA